MHRDARTASPDNDRCRQRKGVRPHVSDERPSIPDTGDTEARPDDTTVMSRAFAVVVLVVEAFAVLIAAPRVAVAATPTVVVSRRATTTEPAPPTPTLRLRPAAARTVIVDVLATADACQGLWTVAIQGRELVFGQSVDRSRILIGGTCAMRLTVRDVPAGRWVLRFDTAKITATVR